MRDKEKIKQCKQKGHIPKPWNDRFDKCENCGVLVMK